MSAAETKKRIDLPDYVQERVQKFLDAMAAARAETPGDVAGKWKAASERELMAGYDLAYVVVLEIVGVKGMRDFEVEARARRTVAA